MKQAYWDKIADNYDEELFDVLSNDRKQLIAQRIRKYGKGKRLAADLGCGSGRFLPILSKTFDKVLAVLLQRCRSSMHTAYEDAFVTVFELAPAVTGTLEETP